MKPIKLLLSALLVSSTLFAFTSCDKDDSEDLNLYDKSEIIGTHKGKATISVDLKGNPSETINNTEVKFQRVTGDENKLNMFSDIVGGPIVANNFKKSSANDQYTFNLANIATVSFVGNEIFDFIPEWYPIYSVNKVEFTNLVLVGNAKYVKSSKTVDFVYKGKIRIYELNENGKDQEVAASNITISFSELRK
ncbi:hypothetical protein LJB91_02065 [Bacteroidales bacterium OttesenSCG-928-L03]|nr:hypothetical protein [Bacteroidales bacterium OttesenSCG-928-L03]